MNRHDKIEDLMDAMNAPPTINTATARFDGIRMNTNETPASRQPFSNVRRSDTPGGNLLRMIRSDESVHCFGGYLFRRDNPQCGHVICFAVENMSDEDIINTDKWYNLFGRMSHLGMLHRTASAPLQVENYTIFEFVASADDRSIRDHMKAVEPVRTSHDALMANLVNFIHNYSQELKKENYPNYVPLRCLSKDTVLIDSNGRMKILPLQAHRGVYPIEIPREVSIGKYSDERSDLFSAAYLAVEIYSKNRNCDQLSEPNSDLIRNCLKAIHDWRPTLAEAYAAVSGSPFAQHRRTIIGGNSMSGAHAQPDKFQEGIQEGIQKLKSYFRDLVRPYELEEAESDFQIDGTMHNGAIRSNEPIDMGCDTDDSTFGVASR